ncbi:MAG TPA: hypothetical protein VNZ26_14000 [Vicinamibacterales bacterium]|nr:hypothetical protein [Vicinamibacterales bacterium]
MKTFWAAIVLGLAVRLACLPLPGTHDIAVWKIWSYVTASEGIGRLYGVGGQPLERRLVSFHGAETTVDYPPLALAEIGLAGRAYKSLTRGRYWDDTRLIVAVKVPTLLADAGLLALLYWTVRRFAGERRARWAAIAYWLNPAIVIDGAMLGYLDPLFMLPMAGAIVAAAMDSPVVAGGLTAAAMLTKPQAIVVAPAIALLTLGAGGGGGMVGGVFSASTGGGSWSLVRPWLRPGLIRSLAAGAAAVIVGGVIISPVVIAGGLPNMLNAFERLGHHDMLSGNTCNVWWIVGYVLRAIYSAHDMGVWKAFTTPTKILQISRVLELGYPNPRVIGTVGVAAAFAWALWTGRHTRDLWMASALTAFLVHAYVTLSAQVHENHLYAAIPLLVVAAAGRPRFTSVLVALSAIFALNLNLFYGISEDIGYALPRTLTIIDATVVLSVVNCAALVWHGSVLRREAGADAHLPALARLPAELAGP